MIDFIFIAILFLISWIDIKKKEIPDSLTLVLIFIGILYNSLIQSRLRDSLLGMGAYSLPFLLIYGYLHRVFKKEVLGFGDVKLATGIGAVVTFTNFEKVYYFFSNSFILGGVYCVILLILKRVLKKKIQIDEIPFAPFISLAGAILILFPRG